METVSRNDPHARGPQDNHVLAREDLRPSLTHRRSPARSPRCAGSPGPRCDRARPKCGSLPGRPVRRARSPSWWTAARCDGLNPGGCRSKETDASTREGSYSLQVIRSQVSATACSRRADSTSSPTTIRNTWLWPGSPISKGRGISPPCSGVLSCMSTLTV